jgi:hypothetical protein
VTSFVLYPLCPFMCLPVSRLFWVSSLAYPNLLGTKDYVVVVAAAFTLGDNQKWYKPRQDLSMKNDR